MIKKRKTKKKRKPYRSKKAKRIKLGKTILVFVCLCLFCYLAYHFISVFNKYNPEESRLVAIQEIETKETPPPAVEPRTETPATQTPSPPPIAEPRTETPAPQTPTPPAIAEPRAETPAPQTPTPPPIAEPIVETPPPPTESVVETPEPQTPTQPPRTPTIRDRGKMYVINPALPKICIIIDDFGSINKSLFDRFNSLDKEVAFAVLPGYRYSQEHMEKAVAFGRETLIHIPMEPENSNEKLEPNTVTTSMNDFEIKNQIETWMYEFPLVVGVNNHMGSKATQDERVLYMTMLALKQNDLFFIDSFTSSNSIVSQVAETLGIKTNKRDIFLDVPDTSLRAARQKIEQIKNLNHKDAIIVITHCHTDVKYRQLAHFIDRLKDDGYQLVSPSMVVK